MDQAGPEVPTRPRGKRRTLRTRVLVASAGAALLAVAGIAVTTVARQSTHRPDQVRQTVNLSAGATSALTDNWYESAPYYAVLDSNAPDLGAVMSATGQKAFGMAFILADGGSCAPAWNGTDAVSSDTQVAAVIGQVRSAGGDVIVSAGGYDGTKLGQVCGTAVATDSAEYFYQSDFQTVLSFAQRVGLGRFTFWSLNRDRECSPPDNNGGLSSQCSSVPQNSRAFTAYTAAFAKSAPVTEPTSTSTPTSIKSPRK